MTEFRKDDAGKRRLSLLPFGALSGITEALEVGAAKYGDDNWRKCEDPTRYRDALLRHLFAHLDGEPADPETGLSHLKHAGACLLFLLEFERKRVP